MKYSLQCIVAASLGIIAMLVLIFIPIIYVASKNSSINLRADAELPYENSYVRVANENNRIMVYLRSATDSKTVMVIELKGLGIPSNVYIQRYAVFWDDASFVVVGDFSNAHFNIFRFSNNFYMYNVYQSGYLVSGSTIAEHCFDLRPNQWSWFGGPSQKRQYWPVEKVILQNSAYLPKGEGHHNLAERYWLNSAGVFIRMGGMIPLFVNQNIDGNNLCLTANNSIPFKVRYYGLQYAIGIGDNVKTAHLNALAIFFPRPTRQPDGHMVKYSIWSTWARYKENVNETAVLQLADEIERHEFSHSQIEIDDNWEECYGSLTFDKRKFPNIKNLTDKLQIRGFRTTLWIHPFVNKICTNTYMDGRGNGYFVKQTNGNDSIQWWQSPPNGAAYIDFTNKYAVEWFVSRIKALHYGSGIDSFKFDAGESDWIPKDSELFADDDNYPSIITSAYVRAVAEFGPMVEVRSAHHTQDVGIFLRMMDLDSNWSWDNGLPNLVTKLLHMNMVGYGFVLPDMIGGNGYNGQLPDKELFIRWLQATVFMPSLQFSYTPWDYDEETIAICRKFTKLHEQYADAIVSQFKLVEKFGSPVNPPIWWLDPNDRTAHQINDEFLLGESILAAPVLRQGHTSRHIYLPCGTWLDANTNKTIIGPQWLMDYPAPLETLPYFILLKINLN